MTEEEWMKEDERMRKLLQETDLWYCGTPDEYERLRQQKYYVHPQGDLCLTLTDHPGKLTEHDVADNLIRMMELDQEELEENQRASRKGLRETAWSFMYDNLDRILQMAPYHLGENQVPLESLGLSEDDLENELWAMGFQAWKMWKFDQCEWD